MLNKKQIKAIEELTGYKWDAIESNGGFDTFFWKGYNISFYKGEIHTNAGDMNFCRDTLDKLRIKESKGTYLFYTKWLRPLADILEEK